MMQANNQYVFSLDPISPLANSNPLLLFFRTLGSPTNRINILAAWANIGLETNNSLLAKRHQSLFQLGVRSYVVDRAQSLLFKFSMTIVDIGFKFNQLRQWVLENWMGSKNGEGFEDVLQRQVTVSFLSSSSFSKYSLKLISFLSTRKWQEQNLELN